MANNPYQQPMMEPDLVDVQPRVSALAVSSLVFGLVCCIPGSGLIATILGGAGLIRISKAEGRLSGRALAVVGLILGLAGSAFWVAAGIGMMYALNQAQAFLQPLKAIESGDINSARSSFTTAAAAQLTDERAQEFFKEVKDELGAYKHAPQGLAGWIKDYSQTGPILEKANFSSTPKDAAWPIPVHFEKEMAIVVVHLDSSPNPAGRALLSDIEVLTASGKVIKLIPPASSLPPPKPPAPPKTPASPDKPSGG